MFNLHYMFLFTVFLPDRGIAALFREMPHYIKPKGSQGRKEGKQQQQKTKNKTLWELSFRNAFYLIRVVRVAWPVYVRTKRAPLSSLVRTYWVPIATLNKKKKRSGRRPSKKKKQKNNNRQQQQQQKQTYVNINWLWRL